MTLKTAVEIVKLCLADNKNFNVINALKTLVKFVNDYDKYRWHDLRKNPEDLPKEDGAYLACYLFKGFEGWGVPKRVVYLTTEFNCGKFCKTNHRNELLAWKEIEEFEVEE